MLLKNTNPATLTPGHHADGDGLYLDVRSASSASWLFRYTYGGKGMEVALGSRKKVDIVRARALRAWCLKELGEGRNPKETMKADKLEVVRKTNAAPALSIYETAKAYVRVIWKKAKTESVRNDIVRSLHADFIGDLAGMQPQDVVAADVKPLLTRLYTGKDMKGVQVQEPTPVRADDIRQRLVKVLSWAKAIDAQDKLGRFPADWENPVRWEDNLEHVLELDAHEAENHPAIAFAEIGLFVAQLRAKETSDAAMKFALEWDVISATRANEAASADWSEFDWANDCWVIPAERMKMRRPHRVPLTDRHHEILDAILGGAEPPTHGPVFTVGGSAPVSVTGLRKLMQSIKKPCGADFVAVKPVPGDEDKGITLHGFRAAFGTWARAEVYPCTLPDGRVRRVRIFDEAMIEESLAHVVGGKVRNDYVREDFLELRRDLLGDWATYCGKVQTNVIPMRRRKAA